MRTRLPALRTLPLSIVGNANPTRLCDTFETHCNIDPITKDIIVCDDNITDVNADAKFDQLVLRYVDILFGHAALNFDGTSHSVDDAGELNESAVPGVLDDASAMISDFGIKKRLSKSFQLRQRAFFVDPYQAARACDIRRQNSRQSPLYVLAAQDAPPKSLGKLNWLYSSIVGRCPAMPMSEMGQKAKYSRRADVFRFAPKTRHRSMQSACPKRANNRSAGRFAGNLFPRVRLGTSNLNSFCQLLYRPPCNAT